MILQRLIYLSLFGISFLGSLHAEPNSPNVLLICVDDLRPELHCFGVDYIHSPNIDKLASRGRAFARHYVQAPTCGASRFALLTGTYGGSNNNALFQRAKAIGQSPETVSPSLPAYFREHGYRSVSVGKVSHHPGGRGGPDWDDESIPEMPNSWDRHLLNAGPWQHPRGWMHGLARGEIRGNAKEMDLIQAVEGPDTLYPDGINTELALEQLDSLVKRESDKPFFLAVGILRPHLPFGAPKKYLDLYEDVDLPAIPHAKKPEGRTTWHSSGEFYKYNRDGLDPNKSTDYADQVRKHYAACVSFADAQVGRILDRLDELGVRKETIVVLWGDHGWHLGEHAIWGKHSLFEESLRSPLIISYPGISEPGMMSHSIVETIDIFPTLIELAGLPKADFTDGVSLQSLLDRPTSTGHPAYSYFGRGYGRTIRTKTHRMIEHTDGYVELYDHRTENGETQNVAHQQPLMVKELRSKLKQRFADTSK
ncbi:sulfatase [Roseiconus lacunae]|uniref:Sulfatase n=1 Tax=Roseiconus lacunae TaxID=2605694 RepID=A0ABT7PF48_9BACT|nr:sulfatase [Roseiconus lacunae]MDM4014836.1 sulfatase [Roseiconus lacunae]